MTNCWQKLDHDTVLNAVEKITGEKLTNLFIRRNSYINRVYELEKASSRERFIVKFYRPGRWTSEMIMTEHDFLYRLSGNDLKVIVPLKFQGNSLMFLENIPLAIFPKKGGRAFDEFDKPRWQEIGRLLARLHLTGETVKNSQRISWRPAVATKKHLDILLNNGHLPPDFAVSLERVTELFIAKAEPLFAREKMLLIHGDCHFGNLIHRPEEGTFIIDFDDISVGPAVQDLWMLLPGTPQESAVELGWFLEGYRTFRDLDLRELELIPALKVMRIIHFASWCALQSGDPDFAEHFPEWGTLRYWNTLIRDIQEIVAVI